MEIGGKSDTSDSDQRSGRKAGKAKLAELEMDRKWDTFCNTAKLDAQERRKLRRRIDRVKGGPLTDLFVAHAFIGIMSTDYFSRGIGCIVSFCVEIFGWNPTDVEKNCDVCLSTAENNKEKIDRLRDAAAVSKDLTKSQRAALAADLLELLSEDAKKRKDQTARLDRGDHGRLMKKPVREKVPDEEESNGVRPRDLLGEELGVNPRYISDAKLIRDVAPKVFVALKNGEITIQSAKNELENKVETKENGEPVESPGEDEGYVFLSVNPAGEIIVAPGNTSVPGVDVPPSGISIREYFAKRFPDLMDWVNKKKCAE